MNNFDIYSIELDEKGNPLIKHNGSIDSESIDEIEDKIIESIRDEFDKIRMESELSGESNVNGSVIMPFVFKNNNKND